MKKIRVLLQSILIAVKTYYAMLGLAMLTAIAFILDIEHGTNSKALGIEDFYLKIGFIGLCGIALMFALHIAQQRYRTKWPLPLMGFFVLIGYFFWFPEGRFEQPSNLILLGVSAVSFHLLVAVIPFWKPADHDGFWDYNKHLFIQTVQTGIFTFVLWGGLALALLAVENLFNLHIPDNLWGYLAVSVCIPGSCLIFTLFAKGGFTRLKEKTPYPEVLKFFVQYILIPLLILYVVILYCYGIKILVSWDLPQGWVSYLVLAYSFLGILSLLLLHPLREVADRIWVRFFFKAFYITLLPLLVLLFVAIGVRISAYGITENRYYVLLMACWLLGITLYQLIRRLSRIWIIPVSLLMVAYLSLWLPGINVWKVSLNSQHERLTGLLGKHQLLNKQGNLDFTHSIQRSVLNSISDKVAYLNTRNKTPWIREFIDQQYAVKVDSILKQPYGVASAFENLFTRVVEDKGRNTLYTHITSTYIPQTPVYAVGGYDYFISVTSMDYYREFNLNTDSLTLSLGIEKTETISEAEVKANQRAVSLYVPALDTTYRYNYGDYLDAIFTKYKDQIFSTTNIKGGDLSVNFNLGNYQARIEFERISFNAYQTDTTEQTPLSRDKIQTNASGIILLRKQGDEENR